MFDLKARFTNRPDEIQPILVEVEAGELAAVAFSEI